MDPQKDGIIWRGEIRGGKRTSENAHLLGPFVHARIDSTLKVIIVCNDAEAKENGSTLTVMNNRPHAITDANGAKTPA